MLVVIMGMLIFSGLAYVSERNEENTGFISMPQVGWTQKSCPDHFALNLGHLSIFWFSLLPSFWLSGQNFDIQYFFLLSFNQQNQGFERSIFQTFWKDDRKLC